MAYRFRFVTDRLSPATSHHRLLRGLPGYLILFDPHAFVPQRQSPLREMPSQSVFCVISMHFTATPHIPPAAGAFKLSSLGGRLQVEPGVFTSNLLSRLRTL